MRTVPTSKCNIYEDITKELQLFLGEENIYSIKTITTNYKPTPLKQLLEDPNIKETTPYPDELRLFCSYEDCQQVQNFSLQDNIKLLLDEYCCFTLLQYNCRNCQSPHAIPIHIESKFILDKDDQKSIQFDFIKFGQYPPNSRKIPQEIITLSKKLKKNTAKDIKQLFSNGLICEGHGLGVGAFSYYRQIVEIMREVLFDLIIKALEFSKAENDLITEYTSAKSEHSFDKSMEHIKQSLPDSFKIAEQNPIKLLFKALSAGVHNNDKNDDDCLKYAKDLKMILTETIKRLTELSCENKELLEAVKRLNEFKE